ncbi:DUF4235 domain-containing protein [Streptomyces griseoviridis]|uniref:DUF4235 domain-containing protein n=2 Tax=Streptomyces TaxID=1883 RepID=A0A3Q9KSG7_STRGD|nr:MULTISPECIES: DUF4235 domain-containing protein [Streptomyces]AZS83378.1 DUF4235 domain-containing protein [Streptomyces griseoviridis]MDH6696156.1 hypothetical protein [Streptomyces sp. MAA16]MDT0472313.1 DUF4235 domain-containing protein [Streptomyces sp. DSM 41014]QCN89769.1 hypothetical protein DDJ31_36355 [Streptomyces griseoviridis]
MARKKNKQLKLPLAYKPVGLAVGWAGGALAGLAFRRTWEVIRHEDDAPDPLDRDRGWGEILLAAAIQGALFAVASSVASRASAKAIERSTGVWPTGDRT